MDTVLYTVLLGGLFSLSISATCFTKERLKVHSHEAKSAFARNYLTNDIIECYIQLNYGYGIGQTHYNTNKNLIINLIQSKY